jgi:hypothetical protein
MKVEIKNRYNGSVIICGEYSSVKDALEKNRGAYLGGADLGGAYLGGADLGGAYLRGADLRGAYLRGADLRGADLGGAYLGGADLRGADLGGAKGIKIPVISISGSMHNFQYYDGNIRIGCEYHSIEYWNIMYDAIGRDNQYTEEQILEYYNYIRLCGGAI